MIHQVRNQRDRQDCQITFKQIINDVPTVNWQRTSLSIEYKMLELDSSSLFNNMKYKNHKQYRLKNFNYSGEGEYFVTICTKHHIKYFGKIEKGQMILSDIGKIVEKTWREIPVQFSNIKLDSFQVMPEHCHGIIIIKPDSDQIHRRNLVHQVPKANIINDVPTKSGIENNPMELKSISLGKVIRWFKGRVTFEAKRINPGFSWQARFYDRIIRNEKEHYFIKEYIENNPISYRKGLLNKYLESPQ